MSRVTLTNPFDLLTDENEDRTNVPTPSKKEQKPAAPAKPAAKPAATGVAAKPAAKQAAPKQEGGAKAPAKPADAKAAPKPAATTNNVVKPAPIRDSNPNLVEREKESRPPRDRRDRPPHPAGAEKREKRQFDRKSGTGRPQTENKRGGQGKNNWGGEVDTKEAEALNKEEKVAEKEEVEDAKEDKVEAEGEKKEETKEEVAPAAAVEEEKDTFTLDEYLAKRKGKVGVPKVEALVPRTVTADDFGGLTVLSREDSREDGPKKKSEKPKTEEKAAAGEKKGERKENLAAKLLKFESHQDAKYKERREYNRSYSDDGRRGSNDRRNKGPRPPRAESQSNVNASKPPVQEKDFPALGPHGSDPVKA